MGPPELTIVFSFRDRDTLRVDRCLSSLARQSLGRIRAVVVDYGSAPAPARALAGVVARHRFADLVRVESQGWLWNRAHAINTGAQQVGSPAIALSDVDMVYGRDFAASCMNSLTDSSLLLCAASYLPRSFRAFDQVEARGPAAGQVKPEAHGAWQCLSTAGFARIRGYDEFFAVYGKEDTDLTARCARSGLTPRYLGGDAALFHQWHPVNGLHALPFRIFERVLEHAALPDPAPRNAGGWGRSVAASERPALAYVDAGGLTRAAAASALTLRCDRPSHYETFLDRYAGAAKGEAVVVKARQGAIHRARIVLRRARRSAQLRQQARALNPLDSILGFIFDQRAALTDYYVLPDAFVVIK